MISFALKVGNETEFLTWERSGVCFIVQAQHTIESGVDRTLDVLRKRHSFLSFPYVCPEPVWAK